MTRRGSSSLASFGETLKREREQREISLREISDATKINIRYLEALEQNRFESLPGGLFNKGFIRAYAAYIGVDSEAMVNSYLQEITSRDEGSVASEGHSAVHRPAEAPRRRSAARSEPAARETRGPAITFAPPAPRGTPAGGPSIALASPPPAAATTAAPAAVPGAPSAKDPTIAALAAVLAQRAAGPRAVSGIEEAPGATAASRPLLVIVSLVAGAGLLFLLLSVLVGHRTPAPSTVGPGSVEGGGALAGPGPGPGEPAAFGEPSGANTGHAPDGLLSAAAAPGAGAAPEARTPGAAGPARMNLRLKATDRTWVQLFCDSHEVVNWVMADGETQTARCLGEIRISAADAAAVRLWINGGSCAPLGERGARVLGYAIRIDDYRQICPPSGRGDDARH